MTIRENVQAVIDGILEGKVLETFDAYYGEDVVMSENRADERVGEQASRAYEQASWTATRSMESRSVS
jgi:hypothetical protein